MSEKPRGWPGGKSGAGVFHRIISLMPPHAIYIEPFMGGFSIGRLKRPANLNIGIDRDRTAVAMAMPPAESLGSAVEASSADIGAPVPASSRLGWPPARKPANSAGETRPNRRGQIEYGPHRRLRSWRIRSPEP